MRPAHCGTMPRSGRGIPLLWGYDLATVDCWQLCSTYHCLQRFRQFELGEGMVCMRVGGKVAASCSAGRVPTWDAGRGGVGGGSSRSTKGGVSCCRLQEAATEPAQPITITLCAGRRGLGLGGSGGVAGLSGEGQEGGLAEWRSQGSELAGWRSKEWELAESAAGRRTVKSGCRTGPA